MQVLTKPGYELNEPAVVAETIDGEAVIINLERGIYFSIKGVGLVIWTDLIAGAAPLLIASRLADHVGADHPDVAQEVGAFVTHLVVEGLIRRSGRPAVEPRFALDTIRYAVPTLDKYTDMEALLLLDPVHDVDEAGWPHRA